MSMEPTQKVCTNGHRMEPEWDVCPYCPSTRAGDPALARTVKVEATRVEGPPEPSPVSFGSAGGDGAGAGAGAAVSHDAGRRTEIIRRDPMPAGVGWLVAAAGPGRGTIQRIDAARAVIGASPSCDVVLEGGHVSDRHASLRFQEGGFQITDLDSTNGTFVNGEAVQQRALEDGDRVALGSSEWVFKCVVFDEV